MSVPMLLWEPGRRDVEKWREGSQGRILGESDP